MDKVHVSIMETGTTIIMSRILSSINILSLVPLLLSPAPRTVSAAVCSDIINTFAAPRKFPSSFVKAWATSP